MNPVTVLIADDHPIFRRGLKEVLAADDGLRIIAEAADGETALTLLRQHRPQIALLDVDMPQLDGFAVAQVARAEALPTALIFLTMHSEERFFKSAIEIGVSGYVLKDGAVDEIVQAVHAVASGKTYISQSLSNYLFERVRQTGQLRSGKNELDALSPAERRVMSLVADFKTNKQIAAELGLSVRTIEHHCTSISDKLEIKGRRALVQYILSQRGKLFPQS